MSKYVVFSFDDGRDDTYFNAYKIMSKYSLKGTINVVTDFIKNPNRYNCFVTCGNKSMCAEQLVECQQNGWEIACHGHTHKNTIEDVLDNIKSLDLMGINTDDIGFASPGSNLTYLNNGEFMHLVEAGKLSYVRSGVQTRRKGLFYACLFALNEYLHINCIFYKLHHKKIITNKKDRFLLSVGITKKTTIHEIMFLINKMHDGECVVLNFHSILAKEAPTWNKDKWFWPADRFEKLCHKLSDDSGIVVCPTIKWIKGEL